MDLPPLVASILANAKDFNANLAEVRETLLETAESTDDLETAQARADATADKLSEAEARLADANRELIATQAKVRDGTLAGSEATDAQSAALAKQADAEKAVRDAAVETSAASDRLSAATTAGTLTGSVGFTKLAKAGKLATYAIVGAGAAASIAGVKLAGDFNSAVEHLVTDAGESQKAVGMVTNGILNMSVKVGQTPQQLANAMYYVESAGFHAAAGLKVLKAAAEGAAAGGTDTQTVADALTSALNSYGLSANKAVAVTDEMIAAVGQGKMKLADLASALSNVLPIAAAAHIDFQQVAGAIATMTAQGMSAQQSTQDLANIIRSLQNPSTVAVGEMEQLGLKANDISKNLGSRGLTGTLAILQHAVLKSMGPSGLVLLKSFNQSQDAAKDLKVMLDAMPPSVEKLAEKFLSGSMSMSQFRQQIPTSDYGMISQFESLQEKVSGFNTALKSGMPAAQTYEAALAKMVGGATGLNVSLLLGGTHAVTFANNVKKIGNSAKSSSDQVRGFAQISKQWNFQMQQAEAAVEKVAIQLGRILIPVLQTTARGMGRVVDWFAKSKVASIALAAVITGVLGVAITAFAVQKIGKLISSVRSAYQWLLKLFGMKGGPSVTTPNLAQDGTTAGTNLKNLVDEAGQDLITDATTAGDALKAAIETGADTGRDTLETGADVTHAAIETGADTGRDDLETGGDNARDLLRVGGDTGRDALETGGAAAHDDLETGADAGRDALETGGATARDDVETGAATGRDDLETGGATARDDIETGSSTGRDDLETGGETAAADVESGAATARDDIETGGAAAETDAEAGGAGFASAAKVGGLAFAAIIADQIGDLIAPKKTKKDQNEAKDVLKDTAGTIGDIFHEIENPGTTKFTGPSIFNPAGSGAKTYSEQFGKNNGLSLTEPSGTTNAQANEINKLVSKLSTANQTLANVRTIVQGVESKGATASGLKQLVATLNKKANSSDVKKLNESMAQEHSTLDKVNKAVTTGNQEAAKTTSAIKQQTSAVKQTTAAIKTGKPIVVQATINVPVTLDGKKVGQGTKTALLKAGRATNMNVLGNTAGSNKTGGGISR